jgi:hypothetical protein
MYGRWPRPLEKPTLREAFLALCREAKNLLRKPIVKCPRLETKRQEVNFEEKREKNHITSFNFCESLLFLPEL